MKRIALIIGLLLFLGVIISYGQEGVTVKQLPYEDIHAKNDQPMPYQYIREADIMWAKIVWERVELSEKQNQILGLPAEPVRNSMSLIDVILKAIQHESLNAYAASPTDEGHEFDQMLSENEVRDRMGEVVDTNGAVLEPYKSYEISAYIVKEIWFFDKQRSVMDVRIIGLCPIRTYEDIDTATGISKGIKMRKLFWVYYPELRPKLAKSPVYWEQTDVMNITYDDVFQKRLFSGYFYMVSNPKNRAIMDYRQGLDVLVEAEREKQEMFNFEQDLWSY